MSDSAMEACREAVRWIGKCPDTSQLTAEERVLLLTSILDGTTSSLPQYMQKYVPPPKAKQQ